MFGETTHDADKRRPISKLQTEKKREVVEHVVKSWPQFFEATLAGIKTHDLRRCDDRDFKVGDSLLLREFDPKLEKYTGRQLLMKITYITSADSPCALSEQALDKKFCILSFQKL